MGLVPRWEFGHWRGGHPQRARHLNDFIGREWPDIVELRVDEWSVLSLLFETHVALFWQVEMTVWADALPTTCELARELIQTGELIDLATSAMPVADVADTLWGRLGACVPDVEGVASMLLDVERSELGAWSPQRSSGTESRGPN